MVRITSFIISVLFMQGYGICGSLFLSFKPWLYLEYGFLLSHSKFLSRVNGLFKNHKRFYNEMYKFAFGVY